MSARDRLLDLLAARGSSHASLAVSGAMVGGTAVTGVYPHFDLHNIHIPGSH